MDNESNNVIKSLKHWIFILVLLLTASCKKENQANQEEPYRNYPPDIHFEVSGRLLEGKNITCIETDSRGNIWIATGNELHHIEGSDEKTDTLDFPILDIAVATDETLWIGTNGGGLGHMTTSEIRWFTVSNAGLPRDYIANVEAAPDGSIWFSSCAHDLGGLVVFNGNKFTLFTPDNSPMNQNVVDCIDIISDGSVFITTSGKVTRGNVYIISGKSWSCLGDENGTFYWISKFTVASSGLVYLAEDFGLSSSMLDSNKVYQFKDDKWQRMKTDFISRITPVTAMKADRRNYCWLAGLSGNYPALHVFNGKSWEDSPDGLFPSGWITAIEADTDNNILIGTNGNGVFILNQ
jgi:ligand-binding sensor domain-containing protein